MRTGTEKCITNVEAVHTQASNAVRKASTNFLCVPSPVHSSCSDQRWPESLSSTPLLFQHFFEIVRQTQYLHPVSREISDLRNF